MDYQFLTLRYQMFCVRACVRACVFFFQLIWAHGKLLGLPFVGSFILQQHGEQHLIGNKQITFITQEAKNNVSFPTSSSVEEIFLKQDVTKMKPEIL